MMLRGVESPISPIIQQGSRLGLTPEQRQQLHLIELDIVAQVVRLLNERDLLEVEAQQENFANNTRGWLTSKQLKAIDNKTAKIRMAWLQGLERAAATLSSNQLSELSAIVATPPTFDNASKTFEIDDINTKITNAVNARLKDAKVLEIESAQAVVDRVISWAKSFAMVVGVPLAVLAVILGALGLSTYSEFRSSVSTAQKQALDQIDLLATRSAQEFTDRANRLAARYSEQESKLTGLVPLIQSIDDRLQRVERIQFGPSFSEEQKKTVRRKIEEYRDYLFKAGYKGPNGDFLITLDFDHPLTASYVYEKNEIIVDPAIINDDYTLFRPYTHRVLATINPRAVTAMNILIPAIESGFADYLIYSFSGKSKIVGGFLGGFPIEVANEKQFVDYSRAPPIAALGDPQQVSSEPHAAGRAWSGAFWEICNLLGCDPIVPRCEAADKVLLSSWAELDVESPQSNGEHFAQTIIRNITADGGSEKGAIARSIFERRGMKL